MKMNCAFITLFLLAYSLRKSMLSDPLLIRGTGKLSDFPMSLSKIPSFEKPNNVSISVYRFEQGRLLNLFIAKIENSDEK